MNSKIKKQNLFSDAVKNGRRHYHAQNLARYLGLSCEWLNRSELTAEESDCRHSLFVSHAVNFKGKPSIGAGGWYSKLAYIYDAGETSCDALTSQGGRKDSIKPHVLGPEDDVMDWLNNLNISTTLAHPKKIVDVIERNCYIYVKFDLKNPVIAMFEVLSASFEKIEIGHLIQRRCHQGENPHLSRLRDFNDRESMYMFKFIVSLLLLISVGLTGCVSNYMGPKPDFSLSGEAATLEVQKFSVSEHYFDQGLLMRMGPVRKPYSLDSVKPVIEFVSPEAMKSVAKGEKVFKRTVTYALVGLGIMAACLLSNDKDTQWAGIYTLTGINIFNFGYGFVGLNHMQDASKQYNRELKQKLTPGVGASLNF